MSVRTPIRRLVGGLAASVMVAGALAGSVSAAPPPDRCASLTSTTYSSGVPDGLRTPGTHRVQWKSEYVDAATGELVVDDSTVNQITIDAAAPAYPNTVLIRLFRNTTLLSDGSVIDVTSMRPTQAAALHVNVSWVKGDKFFVGDFVISYRYETSRNKWTAYQQVAASPDQSFCVEDTSAIWQKHYGWE